MYGSRTFRIAGPATAREQIDRFVRELKTYLFHISCNL